jgi:DNA-binding PadR family transcriptional regulator
VSRAGTGQTPDGDAARFGRNAEPFILLVLHQGRSYGYEIRTRLEDFGFRRAAREPAVVYRLLRNLEAAGLIESEWDVAGTGPARRYYRLTEVGRAQLHHSAGHLERQARRIEKFFEAYRVTETESAEG